MVKLIGVTCPLCSKEFQRTQKQVNVVLKNSGVWRCSGCVTTARNIKSAKPIGSTRVHKKTGYIEEKSMKGWRRQHILVMERKLCRPLIPGEVVHHINESKTDNRPDNLQVMTNGEHTAIHHTGAKRTPEQIERIKSGIRCGPNVRLNVDVANWLKQNRLNSSLSQREIANILQVSPMTVSRAINNKSWN